MGERILRHLGGSISDLLLVVGALVVATAIMARHEIEAWLVPHVSPPVGRVLGGVEVIECEVAREGVSE